MHSLARSHRPTFKCKSLGKISSSQSHHEKNLIRAYATVSTSLEVLQSGSKKRQLNWQSHTAELWRLLGHNSAKWCLQLPCQEGFWCCFLRYHLPAEVKEEIYTCKILAREMTLNAKSRQKMTGIERCRHSPFAVYHEGIKSTGGTSLTGGWLEGPAGPPLLFPSLALYLRMSSSRSLVPSSARK